MTTAEATTEYTTLRVTKATWRRLNARKVMPSDTVDDVVVKLLNQTERESAKDAPA